MNAKIMYTLEYDFHDAIVVDCHTVYCDKKNEYIYTLTLTLYETYYPKREYIHITFSGVYNTEKISKLFSELEQDNEDNDWNGNRLNHLFYDTKKPSKDLNLFLHLDIEYFKPITIHCKEMSIENMTIED